MDVAIAMTARCYSIEREYEDIYAMADMIAEPFDIVAHSFGAGCALGAAGQIPNLNHLILYEPPQLTEQQSDLRLQQIERMDQALARGDREESSHNSIKCHAANTAGCH